MELFRMQYLGKFVSCSDCRFWDWYYNELNSDDEDGRVIQEFGDCTRGHGRNIHKDARPVCDYHFKWRT